MIRVIVTDDSAFMRKILSEIISSDPELEVVATARDGQDLLDKLPKYKPDVITLDISMPVMDGITALKRIMQENPMPVIMISALSDEENSFNCLELGAVDFIPKTSGIISIDMNRKKDIIIEKIKAAVTARVDKTITEQKLDDTTNVALNPNYIVVIGASTGGPKAIESILQSLPSDFPVPIVVVQHIPEEFTLAFANRLNRICSIKVKEAANDEILEKGMAYIAPGDYHLEIEKTKSGPKVKLNKQPKLLGVRPNINVTMKSLAQSYGDKVIGVILTGMGTDGTEGFAEIKRNNGRTIAQDELTCIVAGMPKSAIKNGVVDKIVPLQKIAAEIIYMLK